MRGLLLAAALVLAAAPARAEKKDAAPAAADPTTVELVRYFLKTPPADADPKLIEPFLAVNAETLPRKLRGRAAAKQAEIGAILRLHETRKAGVLIQPAENCGVKDFVKPLATAGYYADGYEEVTEDELKYVMDKTKCTEIDLGCRFSMLIFYEKKKDRVLKFTAADPIMALVAEARGKAGTGTRFFGMGLTCMH